MTPTVILVGADKGGVGKTTVSRCLLDYFDGKGVPTRAFDTQAPHGDLSRFNPAEVLDISTIEGQMKVFDGVNENAVTVVDICAGQLSPTIKALDDALLLNDVRDGKMNLVLLHVLGPTLASISEVAASARTIGGARHLLVKNHINKTKFSLSGIPAANEVFKKYADVTIAVPQLPEAVCEAIQVNGGSFAEYATQSNSRVISGLTKTWLDRKSVV